MNADSDRSVNHIHRRVAFTVAIKVTSRLFAMPTNIHSASEQRDYTTILESPHHLNSGFKDTKNQLLVIGRYSAHWLVLHSRRLGLPVFNVFSGKF